MLFFVCEKNLYRYNTRTKKAIPLKIETKFPTAQTWKGNLYSVRVKHGFLAACGSGVLYVRRLIDNHVIWPRSGEKKNWGMLNGVDIAFHHGSLQLFVAHNNGILSVYSLPSMEPTALLTFNKAINYVSCSLDNQHFCLTLDSSQIQIFNIDHYFTPQKQEEPTEMCFEKEEKSVEVKQESTCTEETKNETDEELSSSEEDYDFYSDDSDDEYMEVIEGIEDQGTVNMLHAILNRLGGRGDVFQRLGQMLRTANHDEDSDSGEDVENINEVSQFGTDYYSFVGKFEMGKSSGNYPQYCDWSTDSSIFAATSEGKNVRWWNLHTNELIGEIKTRGKVYGIRFSNRKSNLFAFVERDFVHFLDPWNYKTKHQIIELKTIGSELPKTDEEEDEWYITGLSFTADSTKLFVGTKRGIFEFEAIAVKSLANQCINCIRANVNNFDWDEELSYLPADVIEKIFPTKSFNSLAQSIDFLRSSQG